MTREKASQVFATLARGKETPATPLPAIDTLKGVSMLFIWYVHFAWAWHDSTWTALFRFSWYILDILGPSMFLVLSVIGNMASYQASNIADMKLTVTPRKAIKASFLFIYGECINLFFLWRLGLFHISGWNVITTIALFSLLLPYMLRLRSRTRLAIVAILFILYYPLASLVSGSLASRGITTETILPETFMDPLFAIYWFFFCQGMMTPIFPWIAVPLLTTVIFEGFIKAAHSGHVDRIQKELRRLLMIGLVLIATGVGLGSYTMPDFNTGATAELLTTGGYFTWPFQGGIAAFLVRHVPQYLCYNIGFTAIAFSMMTMVQSRRTKHQGTVSKVDSFGRLSLTAYMLSHIGLVIPIKLSIELFFCIFLPLLVGTVLVFNIWVNKWKSIGSLDWTMNLYTNGALYGLALIEKQHHARAMTKGKGNGNGGQSHVPAKIP
jgi:hypothetical protein